MRSSIGNTQEGLWKGHPHFKGIDSGLRNAEVNPHDPYNSKTVKLMLGSILFPEIEPIFKQTTVTVDLMTNGWLTGVGWPGPNVEANIVGLPVGFAIGIHGLYESPLPGQQVVVGFIDGCASNPVVIQKYPYNAHNRFDLEIMHFLPMTQKLIGPTDVVLGHHTGCFIALRGTLPMPSEIDMFSLTTITITSLVAMTVTTAGVYAMTVGGVKTETVGGASTIQIGGAYALNVGGAIAMTAGVGITLTAGVAMIISGATVTVTSAGPLMLVGVPGIMVNAGVFPVACIGDLVATMLGPMPVLPGPGRIPTSLTTT